MALAPASASAQLVLRSFGDGSSASKSDLTALASQLRSGCTRKAVVINNIKLSTAFAHVEAQLKRNASAKALKAFARSSDARSAPKAASAVFGAVGDGKPWAAIDAALRVHQLDPRNAGPLISLAGLVTAQGMAQEGLAMLDAAGKLKTKGPAPMGIDYGAVASNNRGYALLLLGHPKQAIGYLRTAEQKAPLLSEARINLDAAQQCSWLLLPGGSRGQPPVIADPPLARDQQSADWTTDADGNPVQVASSIFDLSHGTAWQPVNFTLPDSPAQGRAMFNADYYQSLWDQLGAKMREDQGSVIAIRPGGEIAWRE